MENLEQTTYGKALDKVKGIKAFYDIVFYYVVFIVFWVSLKNATLNFIITRTKNLNDDFTEWFNINAILIPVLCAIGIAIYGLYVYNVFPNILKKWEDRKLKELLEEDELSNNARWE